MAKRYKFGKPLPRLFYKVWAAKKKFTNMTIKQAEQIFGIPEKDIMPTLKEVELWVLMRRDIYELVKDMKARIPPRCQEFAFYAFGVQMGRYEALMAVGSLVLPFFEEEM